MRTVRFRPVASGYPASMTSPHTSATVPLDGKIFAGVRNAETGQVGASTRFHYHQEAGEIWAEYSGGEIRRGHLVGTRDGEKLTFRYAHLSEDGTTATGRCESRIVVLDDGRVRLEESWAWESRPETGTSIVEEVRAEVPPAPAGRPSGVGPSIRRADVEDVPALQAFWAVAGENASRPGDDAALVENLLRRDADAILVAEVDGEIVGTVIAGWDGWRAHLYRLAVDPDSRGQGIGRLLMQAAEERLRSLGAIRFDAMVLSGNTLGERAWAAMGYELQEDWRRWVRFA